MSSRAAKTQDQVSFDVSAEDRRLIDKIVTRAMALSMTHGVKRDRLELWMDVTACHANGNPLNLVKLYNADDFNLSHDVFGIERHLNRETGELMNFFSPRCSLPEASAADQ